MSPEERDANLVEYLARKDRHVIVIFPGGFDITFIQLFQGRDHLRLARNVRIEDPQQSDSAGRRGVPELPYVLAEL